LCRLIGLEEKRVELVSEKRIEFLDLYESLLGVAESLATNPTATSTTTSETAGEGGEEDGGGEEAGWVWAPKVGVFLGHLLDLKVDGVRQAKGKDKINRWREVKDVGRKIVEVVGEDEIVNDVLQSLILESWFGDGGGGEEVPALWVRKLGQAGNPVGLAEAGRRLISEGKVSQALELLRVATQQVRGKMK